MIIWSGWGVAVPLITAFLFAITAWVLGLLGFSAADTDTWTFVVAGVLSGLALWLVGRRGGSFFFIPTRYWAVIIPLVSVAIGLFSK